MPKLFTGANSFKALEDQKVEFIFGYPGGAVLPIYDELKNHKSIRHILARHEQGAGHAVRDMLDQVENLESYLLHQVQVQQMLLQL